MKTPPPFLDELAKATGPKVGVDAVAVPGALTGAVLAVEVLDPDAVGAPQLGEETVEGEVEVSARHVVSLVEEALGTITEQEGVVGRSGGNRGRDADAVVDTAPMAP